MIPHYAVVQYDGSGFAGWQRQLTDRTVQAELETALERLNGGPVTVHGAGRTDAGVHSLGQVASFELQRAWPAQELQRALNANTPRDIWCADAGQAHPGFHARKSADARQYRYVVGCDDTSRSPFRRPFEWALGEPLELAPLNAGAALLRGAHDFTAFSAVGQDKPHRRCDVTVAEWSTRPDADGFIFTVQANRFLHRMVRFLVGTMVDVARDRRPLDDINKLLTSETNRETSPPAPPEGLYFEKVHYPQHPGVQE